MSKSKPKLKTSEESLNPTTLELEFFGIFGCSVVLIIAPLFLVVQFVLSSFSSSQINLTNIYNYFSSQPLLTTQSVLMYLGWLSYQLLMWYIIPGPYISGAKLRDGTVQLYKQNGFKIFLLTQLLTLLTYLNYGEYPFLYIISNSYQLLITSILFTSIMSVVLYISSFKSSSTLLSLTGNSGHLIPDLFMGRQLNPTIGSLDLKEFFELRPGLMGWCLLNFCYLVQQHSSKSQITYSLLLVVLSQNWYVGDSLYSQSAILTTMDITTDGFGFMLAFGDISFLPFFYTIQARYLANNPVELTNTSLIFLLLAATTGYIIFRGANNQKNQFKKDPNHPAVKHLKFIQSEKGNKLLIQGWWGIASHINYLGDWLLSLAQCMACGFLSPIPYLFVFYFAILLIHRDSRDDHQCKLKYGKTWVQYRALVPYRIVPYLY